MPHRTSYGKRSVLYPLRMRTKMTRRFGEQKLYDYLQYKKILEDEGLIGKRITQRLYTQYSIPSDKENLPLHPILRTGKVLLPHSRVGFVRNNIRQPILAGQTHKSQRYHILRFCQPIPKPIRWQSIYLHEL